MDLICPKCAEPTDNDSLHDAVEEALFQNYREAAAAFRSEGCTALGFSHNEETVGSLRAQASWAIMDLLGDDMDGAASMMEDFEYMGMLD